jgi:ubiquinone/menaquinone biosynthesis C-methylase UbiE
MRQRAKIVPRASGQVLEIGFGSGLNLSFYPSERIEKLYALEPADEMWALADNATFDCAFPVQRISSGAENIPLPAASIDTVLVTYTMCTIPDVTQALKEMGRVLKPDGQLLFCEHGLAPDTVVRRWQHWLNPFWKRFGGGCNLNRPIERLIRSSGFMIKEIHTMYLPGFKPATYNYWGRATPITGETSMSGKS